MAVVEERRTVGEKLLAVWSCLVSWQSQSSRASVRAEVTIEQGLMLQLKVDIENGRERHADDGQQQKATESLMLGLVLVRLFAPPSVDPVQEMQLVRNCLHYQLEECEGSLAAVKQYFVALYGALSAEQRGCYGPLLMEVYQQRLEECQRRLREEDMQQQVYRPPLSLYGAMTQDCAFMKSSLLQRLSDVFLSSGGRSVAEKVKLLSGWLPSMVERMEEVGDKYFVYRDIVAPFLAGIQQVVCALEVLTAMWDQEDFLLGCRVAAASLKSVWHCVEAVGNPAGQEGGRLVDVAEKVWKGRNALLRLYKGAPLDQLNLHVQLMELVLRLLSGELQRDKSDRALTRTKAMTLRFRVFDQLAKVWSLIEEERKKVELQKDNLYKLTKDSDKGALERIFPTYRADFEDEEEEGVKDVALSAKSHLRFVETAQKTFVSLFGQFVSPAVESDKDQSASDVQKALRISFDISKDVMQKCPRLHDLHVDVTSFLHKIQDEMSSVEGREGHVKGGEGFNFYHDASVEEARQCVPLLVDTKERVLTLLDQWPAHPVLNDIVKTVDKMRAFGMTEPLAKLLTGMELVLDKCQSWEVNAHAGVSLQPQMAVMGDVILRWRKLELREWRSALDVVARDRRQEASRWWLHLYNAVQETSQGTQGHEVATFVIIVQKFMETSTLGSFGGRLDLLKSFFGHLSTIKAMTKSKVYAALYNLQAFYSQFEVSVRKQIAEVRKPIEKELKEAIKIIQWNQMNYWALKETIAKAHRVVHNHVRKFQAALDEAVSLDQGAPGGEGKVTMEKASGLKTSLGPLRTIPDGFRLKNLPAISAEKLLKKGRRLVKGVLKKWQCSEKIEFVQEVAEEFGTRFKALEVKSVDTTGKEGQKKMKELASRRRLAFKHLTETLKELDFSYRKGMMVAASENPHAAFVIAPPDFVVDGTGKMGGRRVWEKCEEAFFANYAQLALFRRQLEAPAKTISTRDVAVMKGYVEHLQQLIVQRRQMTVDLLSAISRTALHQQSLQQFCVAERSACRCPLSGDHLAQLTVKGRELEAQLQSSLKAYSSLLSCAPHVQDDNSSLTLKTCRLLYGREEEVWRSSPAYSQLSEKITKCQKVLGSIQSSSVMSKEASTLAFHRLEELREIQEYSAAFRLMEDDLRTIRHTFSSSTDNVTLDHLLIQMHDFIDSCALPSQVADECHVSVQGTVVRCLKAIERLSQAAKITSESTLGSPFATASSSDFDAIDMEKVLGSVQLLVKQADQVPWDTLSEWQDLKVHQAFFELWSVVLGQMGSFSLQLLQAAAQLMTMLMKVFTELVVNSFGAPDDQGKESEEVNGKEVELEETEETGMGEGQGLKDVSDKIESQDQLEDLKKDKDEKKEEDEGRQDVADEEQGIEMTDDFEGQMHDVPINQQGS
ncbi:hypothetical protein RvY_06348-2 [Ramazzottius varieornatus]|uniref:VWFA domain-containing protein n=1 Tax=Ramazzottius varieornatus TaxID=947166 RepID=A0A1D1V192_RAMVA|nr:hypothetical protein RvY_06348-2 [Ramazzottius varieornatus]